MNIYFFNVTSLVLSGLQLLIAATDRYVFFSSASKALVLFVELKKVSNFYKEEVNAFTGFTKLRDCESTKFSL